MNELELLSAFVAKTLNIAPEQVADLVKTDDKESIKDNALQLLLDKDVERIASLKLKSSEDGKSFDNGYNKAKSEVLTNYETEVKKKFNITSEVKGHDLINEIINSKTENVKKKEITEDDIKRSDFFLQAAKDAEKQRQEEVEKIKLDHQKEINVFVRKERMSKVYSAANEILNKSLIDFSKDPIVADKQKDVVRKLLADRDFDVKEDGTILPLNSEGKLLEDNHGHAIPFDSIVLESASFLPTRKAEDRDSGGGAGDGDENPTGFTWNGQKPKSDSEYMKYISEANTIEEKKAITEAFEG